VYHYVHNHGSVAEAGQRVMATPEKQRNLDPLRGQPRRLIFVDTESRLTLDSTATLEHHQLRLGVAIWGLWDGNEFHGEEVLRFESADAFWSWVESLLTWSRKTTIFAHNLHFDFTLLDWWNQVVEGRFRLEITGKEQAKHRKHLGKKVKDWHGLVVLERTPYFFQAWHKRGRLDCVDSCNYFAMPLAKIGDSVKLPKLPMPERNAPVKDWYTYCERDTRILQLGVCGLLREWCNGNYGPWQYTAPALAYRAWQHSYCDAKPRPHDNDSVRMLERAAYFGGRAHCWFIGDVGPTDISLSYDPIDLVSCGPAKIIGQSYIMDVRSMYPSLMLGHDYPIELIREINNPTMEQLIDLVMDYCVVANVTLRTEINEYPYRTEERVIYPVGVFNTSLCTPELRAAIDDSSIVGVSHMAIYKPGRPFDSYVNHWWGQRQRALEAGDEMREQVCKLMLNSLYGRFGMRRSRWVIDKERMGRKAWGQWYEISSRTGVYECWRSIGYYAQRMQSRAEHPRACPSVSAHVCSYGRCLMRGYRELCGRSNVYYQDTDSIFTNSAGVRQLSLSVSTNASGLGSLRVTHKVEQLSIRGVKNYIADGREVIAGINTANPQFGPRCYLAPEFAGPGTLLGHGRRATIDVRNQIVRVRDYHSYDEVMPDGWTRPLVMS
jgi:DNA polymerase type B, organellar and viral